MNAIENWLTTGNRFFRRARVLVLALALCMSSTSLLFAASKKGKKEEVVEAPTKSYVLPYMVVMFFAGIGLMCVCRPSKRKDKVDEQLKNMADIDEDD